MSNFNDLIEISGCDNSSRRGDVIFVHGLGGTARGTWHPQEKQDDDNFWCAWLGEDFPDVGIWLLGYEVEPFRWKGNSMPLTDRATNSLDLLDSYEIGDRPIIFVTHSMGGLLVKQMLRSARDFGKWSAITQKTRGIVFLSTPHSGSDMASWIKHIGGILQTTVSVEELEAHHSRLRELNLLYRNDDQFSQIPMLVYCETRPTKGILVVNQTSADPGIKGVIPVPMDFDHISICKVADKKSQIYRQVKRFIQKNLTTSPEGKATPQENDGDKPQDSTSMTQINHDNVRAYQTRTEGGHIYIGEKITNIYQDSQGSDNNQKCLEDESAKELKIVDAYVIDDIDKIAAFHKTWLETAKINNFFKKYLLFKNSLTTKKENNYRLPLIDIKLLNLSDSSIFIKEIIIHYTLLNKQTTKQEPNLNLMTLVVPTSGTYHAPLKLDSVFDGNTATSLKISHLIKPNDVDRFVIILDLADKSGFIFKGKQKIKTIKIYINLTLLYNSNSSLKIDNLLVNMPIPIDEKFNKIIPYLKKDY